MSTTVVDRSAARRDHERRKIERSNRAQIAVRGRLTVEAKNFAREYSIANRVNRAADAAGISRGLAEQMVRHPLVLIEIDRLRLENDLKFELKRDWVLAEIAKIARSNALDYFRIDDEGQPVLDLSELTRDEAAAIANVEIDEFTTTKGEYVNTTRRTKFKLHSKLSALELAAKITGVVEAPQVNDNRTQISVTLKLGENDVVIHPDHLFTPTVLPKAG